MNTQLLLELGYPDPGLRKGEFKMYGERLFVELTDNLGEPTEALLSEEETALLYVRLGRALGECR